MTILTGTYRVDRSILPTRLANIEAKLDVHKLNGKNEQPFLSPLSEDEVGRGFVRFWSGIIVKLGDGTVAKQTGQIVVTKRRLLGMVTSGSVGALALNPETNHIFVFSFDFDDAQEPITKDNWRGKPLEATFKSKEGVAPAFLVQVFSVQAIVKNDGSVIVSFLERFLRQASAQGRAELS